MQKSSKSGAIQEKSMKLKNQTIEQIISFLSGYLHGKSTALKLSLITFFSKGHLLIEDMPGLGKTTLAIAIAKSLGLELGRIQCTSDLLPSDITGLSVYNKNTGTFDFHQGPIFNNIVLVDEINRATPKTQSALLEVMGEKQATIEGKTYKMNKPFFVIATQNPIEQFGTFPLPESQLDRFMMKINIGYASRSAEMQILQSGSKRDELYSIQPIITKNEVSDIQQEIKDSIYISEKVLNYILDIVEATRNSERCLGGISTRGVLAISATAKAKAYFSGRDFVIPEDVKELAEYTIPHRIIFREEYDTSTKKEMILSLIGKIPLPV